MAAPATYSALGCIKANGTLKELAVKELELPKPSGDEVLVKVRATGLNPVDWKMVKYNFLVNDVPKGIHILGCDMGGDVVAVGPDCTTAKVGDAVSGFVSLEDPLAGSHAEYSLLSSALLLPKPADWSYESAATLSMPTYTAVMGLSSLIGDVKKAEAGSKSHILVWGASSSVGLYVTALATRAGLKVIGICSEHNFEAVKTRGAVATFSYKKDSVLDDIKAYLGDEQLQYAYDCVSAESATKCVKLMAGDKPGKMTWIAGGPAEGEVPANVTTYHTLLLTAYSDMEMNAVLRAGRPEVISAMEEGILLPSKVELIEGLEAIPDALAALQDGKISGAKFVARVSGDGK